MVISFPDYSKSYLQFRYLSNNLIELVNKSWKTSFWQPIRNNSALVQWKTCSVNVEHNLMTKMTYAVKYRKKIPLT